MNSIQEILLTLAERVVGGTDTLAKAITNVVNYLLDDPVTLRGCSGCRPKWSPPTT